MVEIIIKGERNRKSDQPTFMIATIKAGIVLRNEGGIYLTISDQKLSRELKEFFEKRKTRTEKICEVKNEYKRAKQLL